MNTKKLLRPLLLILTLTFISCSNSEIKVESPDGNYTLVFNLNEKSEAIYHVDYKGTGIIEASKLGLGIDGLPTEGLKATLVETKMHNAIWKPPYGTKTEYPEKYSEALVKITTDSGEPLYNLRFRAYDEGVALRYEFPENKEKVTIEKELTEFSVKQGAIAYTTRVSQGVIQKTPVDEIKESMERPLLINLSDSLYVAIGEAAQINYSRMKLNSYGSHTLQADIEGEVTFDHPFVSPWRFVMAGKTAGEILENNYLVLNLNEPNKIADTSWMKPGKVIRDLTLTTEGGKAYIDFAVKHNIQYVIESAGWYGNEFTKEADASTVTVDPERSTGPLDMPEVIRYGKEQGVDIMVYVNRNQLEKQLDDILPLYRSWGIKGIKYGFVRTGDQYWTNWMHEAVRKAADHEMVLSIHDDYRPVGYSRTYPNLMTMEGIRGDEESPSNEQTLMTMFTRMIAGAGDNTVCYFAPRVTEKMGSHASQLAKTVCLYSPLLWLYWYDRPETATLDSGGAGGAKSIIKEVPELEFFDNVPTVWDDIKVLHSEVGELGTIARKSKNDWFIGTINGQSAKDVSLPLDFLDDDTAYIATVYFDDPSVDTETKVGIERLEVNSTSSIQRKIAGNNGMAIHITYKTDAK
ncbi:glycoside hydrolase family 97 protein [Zobellia galactanivorans]|uniref:glycoside hydrolase family 97 protein n=1 Tax=Zobellia galactanivorans (strain DSM 12802 / CCUG 47099 / CIP 106680 / NCIMB 13871 / Dsij) TaxID=63186 RepID=UPI001C06F05B|nr:glycoside hydrolase family 97 protein [Zobellia galactanivorans]MBU3025567.1 glycoside hydrolase family 97 protein [Zobellia galactanivorans]